MIALMSPLPSTLVVVFLRLIPCVYKALCSSCPLSKAGSRPHTCSVPLSPPHFLGSFVFPPAGAFQFLSSCDGTHSSHGFVCEVSRPAHLTSPCARKSRLSCTELAELEEHCPTAHIGHCFKGPHMENIF